MKIVVVIIEDTVGEKRNMLELFNCLDYIYASNGIEDIVRCAKGLASRFKSVVIINQFDNLFNFEMYSKTIAKVIINVMVIVDYFYNWG